MKIKIFDSNDRTELELEVNAFIAGKIVQDIKYSCLLIPTQYRGSAPSKYMINERAMVMYNEPDDKF